MKNDNINLFVKTGAILVLVLSFLFIESLSANKVLFSNDAPYETLVAYSDQALNFVGGGWTHLNWIGGESIGTLPTILFGIYSIFDPVIFSKFSAPFALFLLGLSYWVLFRSIGLPQIISVLGSIAGMLSSDPFSYAAWGLPSTPIGMFWIVNSITIILYQYYNNKISPLWMSCAGFCVGMSVMELYDAAIIMSVFVGILVFYVSFLSMNDDNLPWMKKLLTSSLNVIVVVVISILVSSAALSTLINTQVKGVSGMGQSQNDRAERWAEATQWSLPKLESLSFVVPGLFGYSVMSPDEKVYWGRIGMSEDWCNRLQNNQIPKDGQPPIGYPRHSGAGFYCGVFVVFLCLFFTYLLVKIPSTFEHKTRKILWFFITSSVICLILSFGKYTPLYKIIYFNVPFFSTIRNPIKFLHPFSIFLTIIFGLGMGAIWKSCSNVKFTSPRLQSSILNYKNWILNNNYFFATLLIVLMYSLVGLLLFTSSFREMTSYLIKTGLGDKANIILTSSVFRILWSIGLLSLFIFWVVLYSMGYRRKPLIYMVLVCVIGDLYLNNLPWITYVNYKKSTNLDNVSSYILQNHDLYRTTARTTPNGSTLAGSPQFNYIYSKWLNKTFQYYKVPMLDIIQMPRVPELDKKYLMALCPTSKDTIYKIPRLWELTSTKFILASIKATKDLQELSGYSLKEDFTFNISSDAESVMTERYSHLIYSQGAHEFGVFELTNTLPRICLFSNVRVFANDDDCLQEISSPDFNVKSLAAISHKDPLFKGFTGEIGSNRIVEVEYSPTKIKCLVNTSSKCLLVVNDKYSENWKVKVNGIGKEVLRCNFIMKGVILDSGSKTVEFTYNAPGKVFVFVSGFFIIIYSALLVVWIYRKITNNKHEKTSSFNRNSVKKNK